VLARRSPSLGSCGNDYNKYCNRGFYYAILLIVNTLPPEDALPDLMTVVVTVEEIRLTLGPAEEHWRKASFMTWKELPESFDAAFGDEEVAAANALPLRDLVRGMYREKKRTQTFEAPYTDYMIGETGIGKSVRRSVTVHMRYQGDVHFDIPVGTTSIERGVGRRPAQSAPSPAPSTIPAFLNSLIGAAKKPFARLQL
jgi:hypothetical protein